MTNKVDIQTRQMELTPKLEEYVASKAGRLDKYLPLIEEARVELTHHKSARLATDRSVAEITVWGKGVVLRTEERSDEPLAAFDSALDKLQRKIERYKGKHYHGRGDGRSVADALAASEPEPEDGEASPLIVRRKTFAVHAMNELEAVEQMKLLGHENFFIFLNDATSHISILYRRRDGSYGLIEPAVE